MTSPDVSPFVDLTLYDANPTDLLDLALAAGQAASPGIVIRTGFTEAAVLEGQAAMDAEIIYRVNRLPPALMEGVMNLLAIPRDPGAPVTGTVLFTAADTVGHIIPAGTPLSLQIGPADTDAVTFTTDVNAQILAGGTVASSTVTATVLGSAGNGINSLPGDATPLAPLSALSFLNSVTATGPFLGGRDPETDAAFYVRGTQRLSRLSAALAVPSQFVAAALEQPYVYRCLALDQTNGTGTVGAAPGHLTLAVLGPDGQFPNTANAAALLALLQSMAIPMLQIHLIPPTMTIVGSGATVHLLPGVDPAAATLALATAWNNYLSPLTWPWAGVIRRNEVIALYSNVPGVDYVVDVQQTGDLTLPGTAPMPQAGSTGPWNFV